MSHSTPSFDAGFPTHAHAWGAITARHGEPAQSWEYYNHQRELVGLVLRWNNAGGKTFLPISRIDGRWWCKALPSPRPLYRLPDLVAEGDSVRPPVFVVEGEQAAEAARAIGLLATTSSGGAAAAAQTDWSLLAGRNIVILPDADQPGRTYAEQVADELLALTPSAVVRIVALPGLAAGEDLVEWLARRDALPPESHALELCRLADEVAPLAVHGVSDTDGPPPIKSTAESDSSPLSVASAGGDWLPVSMTLADCLPSDLRWLWRGRIPLGKLTLLIGDPGLGKSLLTLDLAARVTRGFTPPAVAALAGSPAGTPASPLAAGSVILLSAEDDAADTIYPRLVAAGADLARVRILQGVEPRSSLATRKPQYAFSLGQHIEALQSLVESLGDCALVVIDPLPAYMGGADTHNNADVRSLLAPLAELAARTGAAILGVNHLAKSTYGPAIYRSMGSLAIAAAARSVLAVVRDPDEPQRVVLTSVKSNLGEPAAAVTYRVAANDRGLPTLDWLDTPLQMTADELLAAQASSVAAASVTKDACRWLSDVLRDGPQRVTEIESAARGAGFSDRTLRRAKERLRIRPQRHGFGPDAHYTWNLPDGESRREQPTEPPRASA